MPRKPTHSPLRVLLNQQPVGLFVKEASGVTSFRYEPDWLGAEGSFAISLSLPLQEEAFRGERVSAVFENLLPDSDVLRRRVAGKVAARGTDAYSLLARIGRDCVGALQFIPENEVARNDTTRIMAEEITESGIEKLLKNLVRAPLGLEADDEFRISVAGAQEKTALLYHSGKWWKPHGPTPTTHILKTQIGSLQNGVDLSNSVENEFYCLKLMEAFGLQTARALIHRFGDTTALVVERFDRKWKDPDRLLRVPQEDFCQALGCPPSLKYQNQGGPGLVEGLKLLGASDTPAADQKAFLKAQIFFWLIGATDGHAKNFSIFLGQGGRFRMTPFYDVLTAQPSLATRQIERKQMTLAMFVGNSRHYRLDEIRGQHFIQTAGRAGMPVALAGEALGEIADSAAGAITTVENALPPGFPVSIHESVKAGMKTRLGNL